MVEKAEDIIYYEEPADDGTTWYRCDYRGVAIRKPKTMFEGGRKIHIQEEFFRHINQENLYEKKLIRIRDEIEDYLNKASTIEEDDLAIALAAGRYASMKLTKLTGEESTKKFFNECIKTTLKQNILR